MTDERKRELLKGAGWIRHSRTVNASKGDEGEHRESWSFPDKVIAVSFAQAWKHRVKTLERLGLPSDHDGSTAHAAQVLRHDTLASLRRLARYAGDADADALAVAIRLVDEAADEVLLQAETEQGDEEDDYSGVMAQAFGQKGY